MKKISWYLFSIVVIGVALVSFWSYQKYFKKETSGILSFKVEKGNIQDVVKVRGEIVSQKDFDLEFPFSGTVEKIFVKEGQQVSQNTPLMKLETTDFELEIKNLNAQLLQANAGVKLQQAKLDELKVGTRSEEIKVQEILVSNALVSLEDAKRSLIDKLHDAYTKADDAVRGKADQVFNNPQTQVPRLKLLTVVDQNLQNAVESERFTLEYNTFPKWKISLDQLTMQSDSSLYILNTKNYLEEVKVFLDKLSLIINNPSTNLLVGSTSTEIPGSLKNDIETARININTAVNNITLSDEKIKTAESNLSLEKQKLSLKEAGTVSEQILAQEANVEESKANVEGVQVQISIVQEKIRKSTIDSPVAAKINKVWLEKGELTKLGEPAVSLETSGYKIQADISELEIVKIREVDGNDVSVKLDAFPGAEIKGKIISVDPQEIDKDGDKYYRTNIFIEPHNLKIRSGMSADLVILVSSKDNVLKIPELAINKKENKNFVTVLEGGISKEVEIETGISDGEYIEVVKGLNEGQTITVSAD